MMLSYQGPELQRKRWIIGGLAIVLAGIALITTPLGDGLARLSYDLPFLFRGDIANTNVVVVLEDRAALDALGEKQWPPRRTVHARLLDRLRDEGAKLVVFDIMFRNERPGEDEALAAAIRRHGNVILGGLPEVTAHQAGEQTGSRLVEIKAPTDLLRTNAAAWGLLLVGNLDSKFGVRKMTTSWREHETAIWLAAQRAGPLPPDEREDTERWINFYGAPPALDRVTLGQVLELEGRRHRPGLFRGKIVFVGFDPSVTPASGTRDLFATPYTRFGHDFAPGVEVLANACANLVRGDWLRRMALLIQCLLASIFSTGAVAVLIFVERRRAILAAVLLLAALGAASLLLQWRFGLWWNWLVPALVQLPLATLFAFVCPRLPMMAFISYRRAGGNKIALALRSELRFRGYDAFLDVTNLEAGKFPAQLRKEIERARNFIVILSPGALDDRIKNEKDWLRREVSHALDCGKKVIPILIEQCEPPAEATLPEEMGGLAHCQTITLHQDDWEPTLDRLERFLLGKKRRPDSEE